MFLTVRLDAFWQLSFNMFYRQLLPRTRVNTVPESAMVKPFS